MFEKKYLIIGAAALIGLLIIGWVVFLLTSDQRDLRDNPFVDTIEYDLQEDQEDQSVGDGFGDDVETFTDHPLLGIQTPAAIAHSFVGVMIDLAPGARPHHRGLESAQLIVEAPTEGGVPRLLAIFALHNLPDEIGPVRSVRDYFVTLGAPLLTSMVHVGGSPEGLESLYRSGLEDFDENEDDSLFLRDDDVAAPHNAFVDGEALKQRITPVELLKKAPLWFGQQPRDGQLTPQATVVFSTDSHTVSWLWNEQDACYQRVNSLEARPACVRNVAIVIADMSLVAEDDKGRIAIDLSGTGDAIIMRDGKRWPAQWSKTAGEALQILADDDSLFPMATGLTWMQLLPSDDFVSFPSL